MTVYSIGDMAQTYMQRRQNSVLKQQMQQLSTELSSGQSADISRHLGGDYGFLADIEHRLKLLEGYDTSVKEAGLFTEAMQTALERSQEVTSALGGNLLKFANTQLPEVIASASASAAGQMEALISTLNTRVAGRTLFGGVATDGPALAGAETILDGMRGAIAGQNTVSGVIAALDDWFDGGGFATTAYRGATQGMAPFLLGQGETVDLDLKADHAALREMIKQTGLAALAADPDLGFSTEVQAALLTRAGEALTAEQSALTGLRADLGYAQSRIEESQARIAAEMTSAEYARGELLGVDPYDTATRLEVVQFQLESLYAVTVRMSKLSLMEFMR